MDDERSDRVCSCVECTVDRWAVEPWRVGSQVGRTIYVEHETKDDRLLIAIALGATEMAREVAEHVVDVHNTYLNRLRRSEEER